MSDGGDDLKNNVYKETFDPDANKGDLDRVGLGKDVDNRQEKLRAMKACLEEWRPVSLHVAQFLEWQRPWYPAVLFGLNTVFFLLIWYLDLSVLSTLAVLGIFVTLADGVIPVLSTTVLAGEWTAEQEKEYDVLCNRLMDIKQHGEDLLANAKRLKNQLPRCFSLGLCGIFIFLAIVFDKINNFFLMYLVTSCLIMLPGLFARQVHTLVHQHGTRIYQQIRAKKTTKKE